MIPIFYSIELRLKALENGIFDDFPGKKIHGMFFSVLKNVDSSTSERLHGDFSDKAFTISSFMGQKVDKATVIKKNETYKVRISFLQDEIFDYFSTGVLGKKLFKDPVYIGNIEFLLSNVIFDSAKSNFASILSVDELLDRDMVSNNKIIMRFYSPTLFRVGDKHLRYPDSEKIFTSLLRKFNKYSKYKIDKNIEKRFKNIEIVSSDITIKTVYMGKYYLKGFIGNVKFEVPKNDVELVKAANILSYSSFYTGIGYKTTMGLGQAKRL